MVPAQRRSLIRSALATITALALVVTLASTTGIDQLIASLFFDRATGHWLIDHDTSGLRLWLYDGPKALMIFFGISLLAIIAKPSLAGAGRLSRREAVFVVVCLAIVPLAVTSIRNHSNVQCPLALEQYGGTRSDESGRVRITAFFAARKPRGCWPSGHASGGFALLSLGWLERRRSTRIGLVLPGLSAGLAMGIYQIARGAHFASHVLSTGLISVLLIQLIAAASGVGRPSATVEER